MFGVLRLEHERAPSLLHSHMEGRVRARMDRPDIWLLHMLQHGLFTEDTFNAIGRLATAEARRRANAIGGRKGQAH